MTERGGDPARMKLPELIPIPAGAPHKLCECGRVMFWVLHRGKRVPVACPSQLDTKTFGVVPLDTRKPTASTSGVGINHYIDCTKRDKFGGASAKSAPAANVPTDIADRIRAAEQLAEQYGIRCSGAPNVPEKCGGFAVVACMLEARLFATPCSFHADAVQREMMRERRHDTRFEALDRFLREGKSDHAAKFAARALAIREWNGVHGFRVPARGSV